MTAVRDIVIKHCHKTNAFVVSSARNGELASCAQLSHAEAIAIRLAERRGLEVWLDDSACGPRETAGQRIWPRQRRLRTFYCDRTAPAGATVWRPR